MDIQSPEYEQVRQCFQKYGMVENANAIKVVGFISLLTGISVNRMLDVQEQGTTVRYARHLMRYSLHRIFGYQQNDIANFFKVDHTSVSRSVQNIENWMHQGVEYIKTDVESLKNNLLKQKK